MEPFLGSIIWRFFRWLPPVVLRRIFNVAWMRKNIDIDIRPRYSGVDIYLPENPDISVWLVLRNRTHFNVTIDRIILKFYYGVQIADLYYFKREKLKPGEEKEIFIRGNIEYFQFQSFVKQYRNKASDIRLEVLAENESRFHNFNIEKTLDGIRPDITNANLLLESNT